MLELFREIFTAACEQGVQINPALSATYAALNAANESREVSEPAAMKSYDYYLTAA